MSDPKRDAVDRAWNPNNYPALRGRPPELFIEGYEAARAESAKALAERDAEIERLKQATIKTDNTQALYSALAEIERLKTLLEQRTPDTSAKHEDEIERFEKFGKWRDLQNGNITQDNYEAYRQGWIDSAALQSPHSDTSANIYTKQPVSIPIKETCIQTSAVELVKKLQDSHWLMMDCTKKTHPTLDLSLHEALSKEAEQWLKKQGV